MYSGQSQKHILPVDITGSRKLQTLQTLQITTCRVILTPVLNPFAVTTITSPLQTLASDFSYVTIATWTSSVLTGMALMRISGSILRNLDVSRGCLMLLL